MTIPSEISAEEFVEYATFLHGTQWRDLLPVQFGMPRKTLVLTLASGEPIPQGMVESLINLLEERLQEMSHEQGQLKRRITSLRDKSGILSTFDPQSRVYFQHAS